MLRTNQPGPCPAVEFIPTRGEEFLLAQLLGESGGSAPTWEENLYWEPVPGTPGMLQCGMWCWDRVTSTPGLKPPGPPMAAHGKTSCKTAGFSETPRPHKGHPQEGPLRRLKRKKEGSIYSDLHGNQGEVGKTLI